MKTETKTIGTTQGPVGMTVLKNESKTLKALASNQLQKYKETNVIYLRLENAQKLLKDKKTVVLL